MLILLEMANNHGGSPATGFRIISDFYEVTRMFPQFEFAFKFQYRDIKTFIHPEADPNNKYVLRFQKTNLTINDRKRIKNCAVEHGYKTACTPFDERSVYDVCDHGYDILKVGSPSITDRPLLECINNAWTGPIIASVGGADADDIDHVVRLFGDDRLTLMHCWSEYPARPEDMQLNQIEHLKRRYPKATIGFSSHELYGGEITSLAIARGATVIERHVCIDPRPNGYSVTPDELGRELLRMNGALSACGGPWNIRVPGPAPKQFMRQAIDGRMWWVPT